MSDPYIVREAIKVAASAWVQWDIDNDAQCVCGHAHAEHLGDGCRSMDHSGMCNCSVYEPAAQRAKPFGPPQRQDPYGPSGMSDYDYTD